MVLKYLYTILILLFVSFLFWSIIKIVKNYTIKKGYTKKTSNILGFIVAGLVVGIPGSLIIGLPVIAAIPIALFASFLGYADYELHGYIWGYHYDDE